MSLRGRTTGAALAGTTTALFLALAAFADGESPSGPESPAEAIQLSCSTSAPTVEVGGEVVLRVLALSPQGRALSFHWFATSGRLEGSGAVGRWSLAGVKPGVSQATIEASDDQGRFAVCAVEIRVVPTLRAGGRETGRSLLFRDQQEEAGYGLYSYLLLGSKPTDANRDRYLAAIAAWLRLLEVTELERHIPLAELNVTYLPLAVESGSEITSEAGWLLDNYDFVRARALLRSFAESDRRSGPYLASRMEGSAGVLFQDLSDVPPRLVDLWVDLFVSQAAQHRYWEELTTRQLVLEMRTGIAVASEGAGTLVGGLASLISWRGGS